MRFDKTIADPAFLAEAEKRRLEIDPTKWDEMESLAKEVMVTPPDVVARMRKAARATGQAKLEQPMGQGHIMTGKD